jgi:hypothetical protein
VVIGSNLPPTTVQFDSSKWQFSGCNTISIPWTISSSGKLTVGNVNTFTKNSCQNNNDQQYLQPFMGGNGYVRSGNNFYLTRNGKNVAFFTHIAGGIRRPFGLGQNSQTTFTKTTTFTTTTGPRYGTQSQQITITSPPLLNNPLISNHVRQINNQPIVVTPPPLIIRQPKVIVRSTPVVVNPSPMVVNPSPMVVNPAPVVVNPSPMPALVNP